MDRSVAASGHVPTVLRSDSGIERRVRRGVAFSFISNGLVRATTMATGLILARLLTPEDYGAYAAALAMLLTLLSFNELGVSLALVRDQRAPALLGPTVTTISLSSSAALFVVAFLAAPWVAGLFGIPDAAGIFRLMSVAVLIDGFAAVPVAMLTREIQQGRRMVAAIAGVATSSTVAIGLAVLDYGVYSLVWSYLAATLVAAAVNVLLAPARFWPGWDRTIAGEVIRFGMPLAGASLLFLATLNVDYIVVGRILGTASLGYYLLAFNLASWPTTFVSAAVRPVAIAGFAKVSHDMTVVRSAFERSVQLVLVVTVPMAVMISLLSGPLVRVLYGDQWTPAIAVLVWLPVLGGARVIHELIYDVLVALGRTGRAAVVQVLWLASLVIALSIGASAGGIRGVAVAHAVVVLVVVMPAYAWQLFAVGVLHSTIRRPFASCACASALVVFATVLGSRLGSNDVTDLLLGGCLGAATGAVIFLWIARGTGRLRPGPTPILAMQEQHA